MCKYCIDLDWIYDIMCYVPTNNGSSVDIPVRYCPYCGRELYSITYERTDEDEPKNLNKIIEEALSNKEDKNAKEDFARIPKQAEMELTNAWQDYLFH